jgi:hypothetical protein
MTVHRDTWVERVLWPLGVVLVAAYVGCRLLTAIVDGWADVRAGRLPPLWRDLIDYEREVWSQAKAREGR